MAKSRPILCPSCQCLFGYEVDGRILNIKLRDLYRSITGGTVSGPCRRCGTPVTWPESLTIEKGLR